MSMTDPMTGLRIPTYLSPTYQTGAGYLSGLESLAGATSSPSLGSLFTGRAGVPLPQVGAQPGFALSEALGLPAGGSTGIYNNPGMSARAAAAARLGQAVPGGATTAGTGAPGIMGLLPGAGATVTGEAGLGIGARLASVPAGLRGAVATGGFRALAPIAGYGTLGMLGSSILDRTNIGGQNSNWEQGLQGAALGAGVGAGVGSVVPVVGTGLGALAGGAIGGAAGILGNLFGGGGGESDAAPTLDDMFEAANTSPGARAQAQRIYDTLVAMDDSDEGKAAALQSAQQIILQDAMTAQTVQQDLATTLALQTQAADIFAPAAESVLNTAQTYADATNAILPNLPEGFRGIAERGIAREMNHAEKLANAYMAQAQILPLAERLTQYQSDMNQLAQQQFAAAFGGGGSSGMEALLSGI